MLLAPPPTRGSAQPSKRAAQRKAKEDRRKKPKFDFRLVQERLRSKYNITSKGSLCIYLAESVYPPREAPQASGGPKRPADGKKADIPPFAGGEWDLLTQRSLVTIPRKGQSFTHAAIPNPNYKPNTSTCKFGALRLDQCVPPGHQASIIRK